MRILAFMLASVALCSIASAQQGWTGSISGGYAHLGVSNPNHLLLDRDGEYVDGEVGFNWGGYPVGFVTSIGLGLSDFYESRDSTIPDGGGGAFFVHDQSDLGMGELEARIALPIRIGRDRGLLIQPKLGAGLVYSYYDIDNQAPVGGGEAFFTENHDAVGVDIHPSIQIGYQDNVCAFGLEGGYMAAWGNWGEFGHEIDETRIGIFGTIKW